MTMEIGSIFTGIGGIDLACERLGMKTKWQIENDKFANIALTRHFPHAQRYGDATRICFGELARVHGVVGGDPCPK